jgi:hypothetical protein
MASGSAALMKWVLPNERAISALSALMSIAMRV